MTTRVCIIRHGETDWNRQGRIQGQLDIPLNATGRTQALAMATSAADVNFDALYSSDLCRAMDTARALAQLKNLDIHSLIQLRERHFGLFQGIYKDEAESRYPQAFALYQARDLHFNFETGESLTEFAQRVCDVFKHLVEQHSGQQIAVVCHAGVLDIMYRQATLRTLETKRDFAIPNSALNWFHHDGHRWHLDRWDDHQHVKDVIKTSVE